MRAVLLSGLFAVGLALSVTAAGGQPPQGVVTNVTDGAALYAANCVSCHGAGGKGVATPRPGAGNIRGIGPPLKGVGAGTADFYLRTGYMPLGRGDVEPKRKHVLFDDAQIRALVAYVASFGPGRPIPTPHPEQGNVSHGMQLFTEHCAGCHQVVAQGGVVTGALPPALVNATPLQVAQAVRIGPYVMPRFTQRDLSNRQLDSIIRYVEFTKNPDRPGGWGLGFLGPVPEGLVTWFLAIPALIVLCLLLGRRLRS